MEAHVPACLYTKIAQCLVNEFGSKRYWSKTIQIRVDEQVGEFSFSAIIEVGHTGLIHKVRPIWWDIKGLICDFDFLILEAFIRYESAISRL